MPPRSLPAPRRGILIAAALAAASALVLTGCTSDVTTGPSPTPTASPTETPTASPTVESTPTPTGPVLVPEGTAADNLPLFALVAEQVWAGPQQAEGRGYIDALVAAGFDKQAMQVTEDMSTVGNPAESIQFSVLWGQECLLGQVGPATGAPVAIVAAALPDGGCLLGDTRPIDW